MPGKSTDITLVVHFLDNELNAELLSVIEYPDYLRFEFDALSRERKKEWFTLTYCALLLFMEARISKLLGRNLRSSEYGLVVRRIVNLLYDSGYSCKGFNGGLRVKSR